MMQFSDITPCVQTQRLKKAPFTQDLYSELEAGMTGGRHGVMIMQELLMERFLRQRI